MTVDARTWVGHTLYDAKDSKLGTIETVYFDDESGAPVWAALPGHGLSNSKPFVPLSGVRQTDGGHLIVPYLKDALKDAPEVLATAGHLEPEEITRLQAHYHDHTEPLPDGTTEAGPLEQPFRGSSNESTTGSGQEVTP